MFNLDANNQTKTKVCIEVKNPFLIIINNTTPDAPNIIQLGDLKLLYWKCSDIGSELDSPMIPTQVVKNREHMVLSWLLIQN